MTTRMKKDIEYIQTVTKNTKITPKIPISTVKNELPVINSNPLQTNLELSHGQNLKMLVDTGAQSSLITKKTLTTIPPCFYTRKPIQEELVDYQGNLISQDQDDVTLTFVNNSQTSTHSFHVVEGDTNILGLDWMNDHDVDIIHNNGEVKLQIGSHNKRVNKISDSPIRIKKVSRAVWPMTERILPGDSILTCASDMPDGTYHLENFPGSSLQLDSAIELKNGRFQTSVKNLAIDPLDTPDLRCIATLKSTTPHTDSSENVTGDETLLKIAEPASMPFFKEVKNEDVESEILKFDHVDPKILKELIDFMKIECKDVISSNPYEFGTLKDSYGVFHEINLTSTEGIVRPPLRLDPFRTHQLHQHYGFLEDLGLVYKNETIYSSPAFIVPKKSGGIRIVNDFTGINAKTIPSTYPSPTVAEIFQQVGASGAKIFSTLDITAAYYAIKIKEDSREFATICVSGLSVTPTRMLQGLKNASSTFTRAITAVLGPLMQNSVTKPFISSYIDDLLIYHGETVEQHLTKLKLVLKTLADAGLKIQPSKMNLFQNKLQILGWNCGELGMSALPCHIKTIDNFPPCKNIKELQSFLGMCQYIQSICFDFAKKAIPLIKLLRKNSIFVWDETHQKAFESIKEEMKRNITLSHVTPDQPVYCIVDASSHAWGAMLYTVKSYKRDELQKLRQEIYFRENFLKPFEEKIKHPIVAPFGQQTPGLIQLSPLDEAAEFHKKMDQMKDKQELTLNPNVLKEGVFTAEEYLKNHEKEFPHITSLFGDTDQLHIIRLVSLKSGVFSETIQRYTSLEREALALVLALKFYEPLLRTAQKTYILSDASAIAWLARANLRGRAPSVGKLYRYWMTITQLEFTVILAHISGLYNCADFLSRFQYPVAWKQDPQEDVEPKVVCSPFPLGSTITLEQLDNYLRSKLADGIDLQIWRDERPDKYMPKQEKPKYFRKTKKAKSGETPEKKINLIFTKQVRVLSEMLTLDKIRLEQVLDKELSVLLENPTDKEKIIKGILYRKIKIPNFNEDFYNIFLPKNLIPIVLACFHWSCHAGAVSLAKTIAATYYFKNLQQTCLEFTLGCHICGVSRPSRLGPSVAVPMSLYLYPRLKCWSIDLLEGYPTVKQKDKILVFVEHYTRYVILVPLGQATANIVSDAIEKHLISKFRGVEIIMSDNGSNLTRSKVVRALLEKWNIEIKNTTPMRPQSHGLVERSVQSTQQMIKMLLQENDENSWLDLIPQATVAMNSMSLQSLSYKTSYFLMFGVDVDPFNPLDDHAIPAPDTMQSFWDLHHKISQRAQSDYQEYYSAKRERKKGRRYEYQPGVFLYVKDYRQHEKRKLWPKYHRAPVLCLKNYGAVLLLKNFQGITFLRHVEDVKLCTERFSRLWFSLPLEVKFRLGSEFSNDVLKSYVDTNVTPEFYIEDRRPLGLKRASTRANPDRDPGEEIIDFPLASDLNDLIDLNFMSDDDDDEDETKASKSKPRVQFRDIP